MENIKYNGYGDLKVFHLAYKSVMAIFEITKSFPSEEKYSLIDQIRRSSRSVPANIAESCKKRLYPKMFISKLAEAAGKAGETEVWIDVSKDAGYLSAEDHNNLISTYE